MITPNKHTEIKYSILYLAGITLKAIKRNGTIHYDDLKNIVTQTLGHDSTDVFHQSLSFLFLMNKIVYKKDIDSFVYIDTL